MDGREDALSRINKTNVIPPQKEENRDLGQSLGNLEVLDFQRIHCPGLYNINEKAQG
jgi:hypothetical protein